MKKYLHSYKDYAKGYISNMCSAKSAVIANRPG